MKITISIILSLLCQTALAANDAKVKASIPEITAARDQIIIVFNQLTDNDQKERLRYVSDRLNNAENLLRQSLGNPNQPPPPPPPQQPPTGPSVAMYHSDSCSGDLIGNINPSTDCQKFNGAPDVWAIKVNGQCQDINDSTAIKACENYKNMGDEKAIRVYKSDTCSSAMSGLFSSYTDCDSLPKNGSDAWAIRFNGQCQDISDTTVAMACRSLKALSSANAVKIFHSDRCTGALTAAVDRNTRCESLSGLADAWAIETDGKCQDISDTDIVTACNRFKP